MSLAFLNDRIYPPTDPSSEDPWAGRVVTELLTHIDTRLRWLVLCNDLRTQVWVASALHDAGMEVFCEPGTSLGLAWRSVAWDRQTFIVTNANLRASGTRTTRLVIGNVSKVGIAVTALTDLSVLSHRLPQMVERDGRKAIGATFYLGQMKRHDGKESWLSPFTVHPL